MNRASLSVILSVLTLAVAVAGAGGGAACGGRDVPSPSLALLNARIWTGDPEAPWAEALLVSGGRLATVGTSGEVRAGIGSDTRVIDATGRFITPGFIDAHVHLLDAGFRLASVQLRDAESPEEFTRRIGAFAATVPAGTWILGGDWDHTSWGGELPRRDWIDEVTPHHPVWVNRLDGHMALANSLALEAAGVTAETEDVPGGTIERNPDGAPAGILKDNAMALVDAVVPAPDDESRRRALRAAMSHLAQRGVTSVHHMGTLEELEFLRRAYERADGELDTRIYAAAALSEWEALERLVAQAGRGDDWLRFGALKGFVDGSLGSHTAAFHAPYDDQPDDRGFFVNSEEDLYAWTRAADAAGLNVAIHAIGDRANGTLLDIFERVARENGPRDRRFRVEHAQHLRAQDIERFASLDVIASMQPYHAIDDGRWAEEVIGPLRIQTTYAFRSLLDAGARLAFGSDWYVAPPSPLEGIYAAVTRRTLDGKNPEGWVPEQKIGIEEALAAYTSSAAFAAFQDDRIGMLRAGYLADFVVLDSDLTTIPPEEIPKVRVVMTVAGGKVIYEPEAPP